MKKTMTALLCAAQLLAAAQRVELPRDNGVEASFHGAFDTESSAYDACDALDASSYIQCEPLAIPNAFTLRMSFTVDGRAVSARGMVCVAYGGLSYHFFGYTVDGVPVERWMSWASDATAQEVTGAIYLRTIEPIARMRGTWRSATASR